MREAVPFILAETEHLPKSDCTLGTFFLLAFLCALCVLCG